MFNIYYIAHKKLIDLIFIFFLIKQLIKMYMEPGWTPRPTPKQDILLKNDNGRYKHIIKAKNKWKIFVHINYKNHKI